MRCSDAKEVQEMADQHQFQIRAILIRNTPHATIRELIVRRDLSWLDTDTCMHQS